MANFADNFQTLCDRVNSIMTIIKDDVPFRKRNNVKGVTTTEKDIDGRVFNFSDDLQEIRAIAERIELSLFAYMGKMKDIAADLDTLVNRLVSLRLDAPNSMLIHKEDETDGIKNGPKTLRQPPFKKSGEEDPFIQDKRRRRQPIKLASL
jgi:hypothetical protein